MTAAGAINNDAVNSFKPANDQVVLRREQVHKELKNRQSFNNNGLVHNGQTSSPYSPYTPTPTQNQNYETRPQLRSAMRNSRYQ